MFPCVLVEVTSIEIIVAEGGGGGLTVGRSVGADWFGPFNGCAAGGTEVGKLFAAG